MLALEAAPVNFSVEEIQPHELLSVNSNGSSAFEVGQSSTGNTVAGELDNMQMGMALLPDNLDVDPGLQSMVLSKSWNGKKSTDGVRLWAKYFAPLGSSSGTLVSNAWQDFFISSLLNPVRFDWAKSFLSSEAWSAILKNDEMETSISFVLPTKCPMKRMIACVCHEEI
jgi:hypothetical protein